MHRNFVSLNIELIRDYHDLISVFHSLVTYISTYNSIFKIYILIFIQNLFVNIVEQL